MSRHENVETEYVRVLYDYSYISDDDVKIEINADEQYVLLDCTNDEWWQVRRRGEEEFYVPANYVEKIPKNEIACDGAKEAVVERQRLVGEKSPMITFHPETKSVSERENGSGESLYMNSQDIASVLVHATGGKTVIEINNSSSVRAHEADSGDYVNLDEYRKNAGIGQKEASEHESEYANLQTVQQFITPPPSPDDGEYIKTLLGIWKMYRDPKTTRNYYYHIETHELTWKPPRHSDKAPEKEKSDKTNKDETNKGMRLEGSETAEVFGNNDETKVMLHNENGDIVSDEGLSVLHKSDRLERWNKAKSMVLDINFNQPPHVPKSTTLPANIGQRHSPISEDQPVRLVSPTSPPPIPAIQQVLQSSILVSSTPTVIAEHRRNEIDGTLYRMKIMDNGKKVKKSWTQSYVKLIGSNLVFYKDQRAAAVKPGSPNGKPDFIVSLQTAYVEHNPKDVSSKKNNIIKLCVSNNHYLLRAEDDVKILQWFTKIQLTIGEINPAMMKFGEAERLQPPLSHSGLRRNPSSKGHNRNNSTDDAEKKSRIREVLRNLMTRRPAIETLEKKGIIKETVFGAHLKHICERERTKIPNFVNHCITAIESRGLFHDGIYRVSGNIAQIQKLRYAVEQDEGYNLNDTEQWDIHVLTGTLKLFFRELKEPLFTFHLFEKFRDAVAKPQNVDRLKEMRAIMPDIPKFHYETMKFLFNHLLKVQDNSQENRMQLQNIAIVFGPTLIWPEKEGPNLAASMVFQGRIVEYMLLEYKKLFK
ncbi:hypothetical protein ScPMuIL_015477 [Solemya velum]